MTQLFQTNGEQQKLSVADCELVAFGGDGPVSFQTVDASLDRVPGRVVLPVELRRTAAEGAALRWRTWSALSGMVQRTHVCAGRSGSCVRRTPCRPAPDQGGRAADPAPRGARGARTAVSPRIVLPSPRSNGFLTLLDGQVELGGEPTARASQPVISGLGEHTARWFLLQVALLAGLRPHAVGCGRPWSRRSGPGRLRPFTSARVWRRVRIRCQVPFRCHRRNRS